MLCSGDNAASSRGDASWGFWGNGEGEWVLVVAAASACKAGDSAGIDTSPAKLTPVPCIAAQKGLQA